MRRNKKSGIHKERIIMLASSAFVLAALTMTGVYMKGQNVESKDDGYTLDFTALENNADDKMQEISEYNEEHLLKEEENIPELTANNTAGNEIAAAPVTEDDLDYLPQEVGSGHVEIPGLTDQETLQEAAEAEQQMPELTVEKTLHFTESDGMQKPVQSDILMHYSMDKSIYFATLDQYKYNPATIFSAEEGMTVTACAQGKVTSIFENEEIGKAVTLDLGDGYEATYGQLAEITVKENAYVNPGEIKGPERIPMGLLGAELSREDQFEIQQKICSNIVAAVHREYHREYRLWQYLCRDGTCQYCGYGNGKYPDNQLYHSDTYS